MSKRNNLKKKYSCEINSGKRNQAICRKIKELETYSTTILSPPFEDLYSEEDEKYNGLEDNGTYINYDLIRTVSKVKDTKYYKKMVLRSNFVRELEVLTIVDSGSQICLMDDEIQDTLQLKEECRNQARIRDLDGSITVACPVTANIKFWYYAFEDDPYDFYIINNLKEKVGASILVGLNLMRDSSSDDGIFPFFFPSKMKTKKKTKVKSTPKYYRAVIPNIVDTFKKIGNLEKTALKYNISKKQVIKAIMKYKHIKTDNELLEYILHRMAKLKPEVYQEINMEDKNVPLMEAFYGERIKEKMKEVGKNIINSGGQSLNHIVQQFQKDTGDFSTEIMYKSMERTWEEELVEKFLYAEISKGDTFNGIVASLRGSEFNFRTNIVNNQKYHLIIYGDSPVGYRTRKEIDELKQRDRRKYIGLRQYKKVPWKFVTSALLSIQNEKEMTLSLRLEYSPDPQHKRLARKRLEEIIKIFNRFFRL